MMNEHEDLLGPYEGTKAFSHLIPRLPDRKYFWKEWYLGPRVTFWIGMSRVWFQLSIELGQWTALRIGPFSTGFEFDV